MPFEPQAPGTLLGGRYSLLCLINAGGMGAAYEAEDQGRNGKRVVIKELTDDFKTALERQVGIRNFVAEIQVLASLSHSNIPRVLDHFFYSDKFYFVMELIDGVDLGSMLEERRRVGFAPNEVIGWGVEVLRVLEYIHQLVPPLIHRDLKPSNIIRRNKDGKIFVIDFGIARIARPEEGQMIGSLGYASPEQHENRLEPRSDIYSLGVTLYELLTGIKPEPYKFDFIQLSSIQSEISEALSTSVMKALSYHPEDRWDTASKFRESLEDLEEYRLGLLIENKQIKNADEEYLFLLAIREYCSMHLVPILENIIAKYAHECQTRVIPKEFTYFEFILGTIPSFKLIISVDDDSRQVLFSEQEGVLPPRLLGKVNLLAKDAWHKDEAILRTFITHFEETNASGGFSLFS